MGRSRKAFNSFRLPKPIASGSGTLLERAMRDHILVSGRVVERTKGGLMVDVGVPAFMPGSQVDVWLIHDLDQFVGQDIPVKVLKINRRRGNVVVSRKTGDRGRFKGAEDTPRWIICWKAP